MKEFIEKNSQIIVEILGVGYSKKIAAKIEEMFGEKKSVELIYKMLANKIPSHYPISSKNYELVAEAAMELISEKNNISIKLLCKYKGMELQAA